MNKLDTMMREAVERAKLGERILICLPSRKQVDDAETQLHLMYSDSIEWMSGRRAKICSKGTIQFHVPGTMLTGERFDLIDFDEDV